jgi:hypothetical protein
VPSLGTFKEREIEVKEPIISTQELIDLMEFKHRE